MDINNNQQINTFGKGMNTDTSDMYISNELYRYAENLRYITNKGSNSGELRLIEGTKPIDLPDDLMWDSIVAMTSIRDYLIVIGSKTVNNKECFNIWRKNLGEPRGDGQDGWRYLLRGTKGGPTWLPLESRNLSLCGRWESDKNVKLYIADGVHPLMCLRMNNFDEVSAIDDIDDLSVLINYLLPPLKVSISERAGLLKPAKVQYAYTLSDDSGMETSLSILSNTISLYNDNKGYSIKEDIVSDSAADIEITYTSDLNHLTNIRIYRITYRQGGQQPLIELFYEGKRHDEWFTETITDTGSITIKTLSVEEFLSITKLGIIPQEVESKDLYLFLGNIKYTLDLIDELLKDLDCRAQSKYIDLFYLNGCKWDPSYCWSSEYTRMFGGVGDYFEWRFVFNDQWVSLDNLTLADSSQESKLNPDRKSLRRGEVYRYGVILYDKHGRPSSPKFVADVIVPPAWYSDDKNGSFEVVQGIRTVEKDDGERYNRPRGGKRGATRTSSFLSDRKTRQECEYKLRQIGVKFTQINEFPSLLGISGWQIVRVKRSISDKINLTQGIIASPTLSVRVKENENVLGNFPYDRYSLVDTHNIYPNHLLSQLMVINLREGHFGSSTWKWYFLTDQDILMFLSPEGLYTTQELLNILPEAEALMVKNVRMYDIDVFKPGITDKDFWTPNGYKYKNTPQFLKYDYRNPSGNSEYSSLGGWELLVEKYNLSLNTQYLYEEINAFDDIYPEIIVDETELIEFSLNHLYPISIHSNANDYKGSYGNVYLNDNVELSSINNILSPEYNMFAKSEGTTADKITLTYKDNSCFSGTKAFTNWSMYYYQEDTESSIIGQLLPGNHPAICATISSGPTCMLLLSKNKLGFGYYYNSDVTSNKIFPITIANILRINAFPYGGSYKTTILRYPFFERHFCINNPVNHSYIDVFDGDCFVGMFTANTAHIWKDSVLCKAPRASTIYTVPIESDINLKATCGDLYPRMLLDEKFHQLDKACMIKYPFLTYVQLKDAYLYNTVYSKEEDLIGKYILEYKTTDSNNHDCRIHYSQPKVNGQDPDPWYEFKPTNYIDLDTRYGILTGLKEFKDKLYFWQENAFGHLTVNEKAMVQSNTGSDIILGTSDVMQRYDYISTVYGMYKYQHAFTQSNNALYWWDSYNKELLLYTGLLSPMSKTYFIENYINTTKESDKPNLAYDCDYDEIISNIRDNQATVFNERVNAFTSIYTFNPKFSAVVDGKLYLSNGYSIHKMDSLKTKGESYLFNKKAYPMLKYIVNANSSFVKTFDILTMGANFYNGDYHYEEPAFGNDNSKLSPLRFKYKTKLNQESEIGGLSVSNREYDYRLDVPRHGSKIHGDSNVYWGDRMRGKTMQCELSSISNSTDFSLQYIITKYRMSWS